MKNNFEYLKEDMNSIEKEAYDLFKTYTLLQLKEFKQANYSKLSIDEQLSLNQAIQYHREYISLKFIKNEIKKA